MATQPLQRLTEEEYLRIEREALGKSEFHDGQMFAMAGGSPDHSLIGTQTCHVLSQSVPAGCRVFNSDQRIHLAAARTFTYADAVVVCGKPLFDSDQKDNLVNPLLIVEVLSPSTQDYDRGKKFELYRTIESFQEYLIIHQDRRFVEHHSKQEDASWVLREYSGATASVAVPRLGIQLVLRDLYATALDVA
jgi:Uma2 family endonuclease